VNDDYKEWNVRKQVGDPESVLEFWKKAIAVRKKHDVLVYGDFEMIDEANEEVFAFWRTLGGQTALVLLNFTSGTVGFKITKNERVDWAKLGAAKLLISNYPPETEATNIALKDGVGGDAFVTLEGYEGRIYLLV